MKPETGIKQAAQALEARAGRLGDVEFVAACREFIRDWGTLPQPLPRLRDLRLRRLRDRAAEDGRMAKWVAEKLGFTPRRFSRLTRRAITGEVAA